MLFPCCFLLLPVTSSLLIPCQSVRNYLSFFLSQCVNLAISQLASYDGYVSVRRMFCSLFGLWLTRYIVIRQEIQFYKSVFFQFVGFVQVKNLKQTLNRLVFTVRRFSIIILKFLRYVTSTLYKPDTFLRRTAEAGPMVSVLEIVDCIFISVAERNLFQCIGAMIMIFSFSQ